MVLKYLEIPVAEQTMAEAQRQFYRAALKPLGYAERLIMSDRVGFSVLDYDHVNFWLHFLDKGEKLPASVVSFGFEAGTRKLVDEVFIEALKAGGKSIRIPGVMEKNGPGKGYSASIADPAGNIIQIVAD